jgi:hypothetical protein
MTQGGGYLLALHSKIRQAASPESVLAATEGGAVSVATSGSETTSTSRQEVVSYAQALRGTRGKL